ncbi:hypothetical protein FB451DRAFT_1287548 [Mycena latifolia]|nr:hypothetical protein FB451DRAFT_1287548 [Mycena latifolia]
MEFVSIRLLSAFSRSSLSNRALAPSLRRPGCALLGLRLRMHFLLRVGACSPWTRRPTSASSPRQPQPLARATGRPSLRRTSSPSLIFVHGFDAEDVVYPCKKTFLRPYLPLWREWSDICGKANSSLLGLVQDGVEDKDASAFEVAATELCEEALKGAISVGLGRAIGLPDEWPLAAKKFEGGE